MKKTNIRKLIGIVIMSVMVAGIAGCGSSSSGGAKHSYSSSDGAAMASESYDAGAYEDYGDYDYEEAADVAEPGFAEEGSGDVEVTEGGAKTNRKLIRTVNMNVETYDFDSLTAFVPGKVSALGGYIESSSVDGNATSYGRSASYTLRIPAASADNFIASIGASSNITHQSESMEDVTLKYVDINSRKESLQVEYSRLEELLKDAEDIEELIYIENRLSEVRYEIESIESQLRSYDNLVDYTTIYLYVDEVQVYTEPDEPESIDNSVGARISRGLKAAFENISEFFQNLLVFIVLLLPYLLVLAVFVAIIWLIIRLIIKASRKKAQKRREKMMANMPAGPGPAVGPQGPAGAPAPAVYVPAPEAPVDESKAPDASEGNKDD